MVMLTLGTGVGGGIVLDGKLRRGPTSPPASSASSMATRKAHGELRFCRQLGRFGVANGIANLAQAALKRRKRGPLWKLCEGKLSKVDAALAHKALKLGDPSAAEAWQTAGSALGRAVAGLINGLNVERVVIGGGVMHGGGLELLAHRPQDRQGGQLPQPFKRCQIIAAHLGQRCRLRRRR